MITEELRGMEVGEWADLGDAVAVYRESSEYFSVNDNGEGIDGLSLDEAVRIVRENLGMVVNAWGVELDFDAAVNTMMDEDLCEELHNQLAPCSNQAFFDAYAAAHAAYYGEEWELSKANPTW